MKKYKLILLVALLYIAGGCRKESPILYSQENNPHVSSSPSEIFLSFWHGMNNGYVFWDIDPTDWDKVYDEYLPLFQALDSHKEVSTIELSELYAELSKDLIDHHFSAEIKNPRARSDDYTTVIISPGDNEIKTRDYFHKIDPNFISNLETVFQQYDQDNRITSFVAGKNLSPDVDMSVFSFNIDNGIAYIYFNSFSITSIMEDPSTENTDLYEAMTNFYNIILTKPNLKGVIIDVRNNGGGSLYDVNYVLAPMVDDKFHIGYTRSKNGLGRYDYEGWVEAVVDPAAKHRKIDVPIVAIANLHSVSMSEITSMAIKSLPNGYLVGERTFGGTGPLIKDNPDYNYGGIFDNKMISAYTSTLTFKSTDGEILEGIGVTPDVEVFDDPEAMEQGVDKQIEAAIKLIKEKSGKK